MGFLETGEGRNRYRNVSIVRAPGSKGLMALNAYGSIVTGTTVRTSGQ